MDVAPLVEFLVESPVESPVEALVEFLIEFLVTGDEVVRGLVADTNTAATASKLYPLGFKLRGASVVGDDGADIRRALLEISIRADI